MHISKHFVQLVCLYVFLCQVPGYHDVIRQPMDFSTVQSKLVNRRYDSPQQVIDDIRLIFSNCSTFYSNPTSPERPAGQKLARHFERRIRELQLNSSSVESPGAKASTSSSHTRTTRSRKRTVWQLGICVFFFRNTLHNSFCRPGLRTYYA